MKVNSTVSKNINRYLSKNTVAAKYNRCKNAAYITGFASIGELIRLPAWQIHDIGIMSFLLTLTLGNIKSTMYYFKELNPLIKRAKAIKDSASK